MRESAVPQPKSGVAISSANEEWWSKFPQNELRTGERRSYSEQFVWVASGSGFYLEVHLDGMVSRFPFSPGDVLEAQGKKRNAIELEALADTTIIRLPDPSLLSDQAIRALLHSSRRREKICIHLSNKARSVVVTKNVLLLLIEAGTCMKTGEGYRVPFAHSVLAEIAGMSRESVTRSLRTLGHSGFCLHRRSATVVQEKTYERERLNNQLLQDLAEEDEFARSALGLERRPRVFMQRAYCKWRTAPFRR
ncbi:hypothetical protein EPO05_05430 [Patescibacteria group bacterium]|nr:MAG: hypothetical protein EPO05_05430 [Patescibacteria group bacterium]